jgi:hypothetical protein
MQDFYFSRHADPFNLRFMLTLKLSTPEVSIFVLLRQSPWLLGARDKRGPKSTCLPPVVK